jgi:hypothetical protein
LFTEHKSSVVVARTGYTDSDVSKAPPISISVTTLEIKCDHQS